MSLQIKFLLLIGVLALAVVSSIAAARWSFGVLHEQLRTPLESSASVMTGLRNIKRNVEFQARIVQGRDPDEPASAAPGRWTTTRFDAPSAPLIDRFGDLSADTVSIADQLRSAQWYRSRIGQRTWENILRRIQIAEAAAKASFLEGNPTGRDAAASEAVAAFYEIHELIELTEGRILEDATASVASADAIRVRLVTLLSVVTVAVMLTGLLGALLLRRWVQRPVNDLRVAAARLAAGDFDYRVPVTTTDEIGRLSSEVNHMASMVRSMQDERIQRERLAAVGSMLRRIVHNVRNPLSGIRGLAEVTRLDLPSGGENRENLDLIVSTVDTFERWLSELLDATSPVSLDPHENEVAPLLHDLVAAHRPMAQVKNVKIDLIDSAAPIQAMFDPRHLAHALAAVLANAIEAAPPGTTVSVHCTHDETHWQVRISDRGPGIPLAVRKRIFEPHFTTKPTGTGIGLAMAEHVVQAHGGKIVLNDPPQDEEEAPTIGTSLRVRIPFEFTEKKMAENGHV